MNDARNTATASHPNPAGMTFDLGPSPTPLPGTCPFANEDASFMFVNGNAVSHDTSNTNGDWGGLTVTGNAIFQETPFSGFDSNGNPIDDGPTAQLYQGKTQIWTGGGNNAKAQTENGITMNFHGTALDGSASTLDIHLNGHTTTNAGGRMTANITHVNVTCS